MIFEIVALKGAGIVTTASAATIAVVSSHGVSKG
jgi:hypothetical protein